MDIIAHEERLVASGLKLEEAREILRVVASGDAQAMTRADGERLERNLTQRIDAFEKHTSAAINALEKQMSVTIEAGRHQLISTVWGAIGVAVAAIVGLTKLIDLI